MNPILCQEDQEVEILSVHEIDEHQNDLAQESQENQTADEADDDDFYEITPEMRHDIEDNPPKYENPSELKVLGDKFLGWLASHEFVLNLYVKYLDWKDWYYSEGDFAPKFNELTKDQIKEILEHDEEDDQEADTKEL
jgi:hypothetical protein